MSEVKSFYESSDSDDGGEDGNPKPDSPLPPSQNAEFDGDSLSKKSLQPVPRSDNDTIDAIISSASQNNGNERDSTALSSLSQAIESDMADGDCMKENENIVISPYTETSFGFNSARPNNIAEENKGGNEKSSTCALQNFSVPDEAMEGIPSDNSMAYEEERSDCINSKNDTGQLINIDSDKMKCLTRSLGAESVNELSQESSTSLTQEMSLGKEQEIKFIDVLEHDRANFSCNGNIQDSSELVLDSIMSNGLDCDRVDDDDEMEDEDSLNLHLDTEDFLEPSVSTDCNERTEDTVRNESFITTCENELPRKVTPKIDLLASKFPLLDLEELNNKTPKLSCGSERDVIDLDEDIVTTPAQKSGITSLINRFTKHTAVKSKSTEPKTIMLE